MTPDQVKLVQQSFARVVPISEQAAAIFYDRLFEVAPQVKAMFPAGVCDWAKPGVNQTTVVAWPSSGSQSSETIVTWSRNCSSGFRIGMNSKFSPVVFGVQKPGRSLSGTKIAPNRRCGYRS